MKSRLSITILLLLISFSVRLPFFFIDVINWDESTFILMGQSVLDGYLPYTELWDLKPPLAFIPYALFILLFGKSIVAIRLGGTFCVFLTSWLIYLIGDCLWDDQAGILGGILFIVLSGLISSGQATMTEHIALPFLMGGLAVLILNQSTLLVLFVSGILLTVATLIRLNLAYVVVAVGVWVLFSHFKPTLKTLRRISAYSIGSFVTILLTYLPYLLQGKGQTWFSAVVLASLSYSTSQKTIWKILQTQINYILASISPLKEIDNLFPFLSLPKSLLPARTFPIELIGISLLVWIAGIGGIIFIIKNCHKIQQNKKQQLIILATFFLSTEFSILKSGANYDHYLIQIVPFFALAAGLFWHQLLQTKSHFITIIAIAFLLVISLKLIVFQYQEIGSRLLEKQPLRNGASYEVADYLIQNNPTQEAIYLMNDHIVYWFVGQNPIAKSVTHPSNISKEYLLKHIPGASNYTAAELTQILAIPPKFIIKQKNISYLKEDSAAISLLEKTLTSKYEIVREIQGREIYRITVPARQSFNHN